MVGLTNDTIGGFNSLIEQQKRENENKDVFVTTYLFNNEISTLFYSKRISQIRPLTRKEYVATGSMRFLMQLDMQSKKKKKKLWDLN